MLFYENKSHAFLMLLILIFMLERTYKNVREQI